jgi:Arc/MetJ-type ribon-helix-helix transcriptional regulator
LSDVDGPSDNILDGIPYPGTFDRDDPNWVNRTHFIVEPKAPYVEISYQGRHKGLTREEQGRIRVMHAVHAASEVMGLSVNDEAAAANIALRYLAGPPRVSPALLRAAVLASAVAAAWSRGVAVRSEDVYRAYEALGGTLDGEKDKRKLDRAISRTMIDIFRKLPVKSDKDGLRESAARALASELGLDDASSVPLVALARATGEKPITAAVTAATVIAYLIGYRDVRGLWKVIWPPRTQRVRVDGVTVVLGDGDHAEAEAEDWAAKVVCSHCGLTLFDSRRLPRNRGGATSDEKRFSYNKGAILDGLLSRVPQACPRCGARLADGERVLIRSIGVTYHAELITKSRKREVKKVIKRSAAAVLPKGASLAVRQAAAQGKPRSRVAAAVSWPVMSFTVPFSLDSAIAEAARSLGVSKSELIREAVAAGLEYAGRTGRLPPCSCNPYDRTVVRSVKLPRPLLEQVDDALSRLGVDRSEFIRRSAYYYITSVGRPAGGGQA